ncbi:copper chaperone PCu(A)C [Alcanivorax sp. JB21]|uniref:copper chaperone PCu(A)C n=1 Tax=Alcanivorax limicola TaxID=2874102 RepID=UPI001CBD24B0|nr:copper chaperone PCu(A)C [Alcanivorax limicola]MBZ2188634.1 copper chaperone PCu(A)C [Alcanivorax limicola]
MICAPCFDRLRALGPLLLMGLAMLAMLAPLSHAGEIDEPELFIDDMWLRAVPPVSSNTAGYFSVTNTSDEPVTLLGFSTDIAAAGELHTMAPQDDGTRRMQRLRDVPVPAGETVHFAPGGHHLMLFRLVRPLEEGEQVELCLEFDVTAPYCLPFEVRR